MTQCKRCQSELIIKNGLVGSPHKLVLVKSDKIYGMAKDRFLKITAQYEKLKEVALFKNAS